MEIFVCLYVLVYAQNCMTPKHTHTHTHTYFFPSYGNLVCQATLMSSDSTKLVCPSMTICICSPTPVGLRSLANEVIALPLSYMQGSSYMN